MTNIFRQAKQLLDKKDAGAQLTEEELKLIDTAIIPLMAKTNGIFPEDITIAEGLEELAKMVEEATKEATMKYMGLLTDAQKRAGYFVSQDEDFIYLWHRDCGQPKIIAIFLYETATVREIRDKAQKHYLRELKVEGSGVEQW